jgi:hypothetical protein
MGVGTHPAYVTGTADQQLLWRNEYLVAETASTTLRNSMMLPPPVCFTTRP